jgi:hypothetical protein
MAVLRLILGVKIAIVASSRLMFWFFPPVLCVN